MVSVYTAFNIFPKCQKKISGIGLLPDNRIFCILILYCTVFPTAGNGGSFKQKEKEMYSMYEIFKIVVDVAFIVVVVAAVVIAVRKKKKKDGE